MDIRMALQHTATHCNTLATHCNTLATHCNTLATHCNTLQWTSEWQAPRGAQTHIHDINFTFQNIFTHTHQQSWSSEWYGGAERSRLLKIICLFYRNLVSFIGYIFFTYSLNILYIFFAYSLPIHRYSPAVMVI